MQATYCYSYAAKTGLSTRMVAPEYVAASGEFLSSPEPASVATLQTQFPGYVPPQTHLISYATAKLNAISAGGLTVNLGTENALVSTTTEGRADILGLLAEISQGATSVTWYQSTGNLTLTGAQINTIATAVAALRSGAYATWSAIVAAINARTITTVAQIDAPPAPIPAWPSNS